MESSEIEASTLSFADVQLKDLIHGEGEMTQPIEINGEIFEMRVDWMDRPQPTLTVEILFEGKAMVRGLLQIYSNRDGTCFAQTRIERLEAHPALEGAALQLDQKILRYIQVLSDRYSVALTHSPYCPEGFPVEKWEGIFAPMLEGEGYMRLVPGTWGKIYTFKK